MNNRIMIASATSGSGKTTITIGLLEALKRLGIRPSSFKCGPDYIDPTFHRMVLGIDSHNLDSYFLPPAGIRKIVMDSPGDIGVMEGVMGIYDGPFVESDKGSGYDIAKITKTPIILVMNAHGVGRTILPLVKGVIAEDRAHLIKGIVFNRMSRSFYDRIRPYIEGEIAKRRSDIRLLGCIPKSDVFGIDDFYLGLKRPEDDRAFRDQIGRIADIISDSVDVDAVLGISEAAGQIRAGKNHPASGKSTRTNQLRLAVAKDDAFYFYYGENLKMFEDLGVDIVCFSPLGDDKLPEDVSGILIGGGYPELYLTQLSGNRSMLDSVRSAIRSGMPSLAECGGFMYLHGAIKDINGTSYPMVGAIDATCEDMHHPVNFGYVETDQGMKGHEFHYYDTTCRGDGVLLTKVSTGRKYRDMIAGDNYLWGFPHFYYPSHPDFVKWFVKKMKEYEAARHE